VGDTRNAVPTLESAPETLASLSGACNPRCSRSLRRRFQRFGQIESSSPGTGLCHLQKVAPQAGHGYKCSLFAADREVGGKRDGVAKGPFSV
jgi:hypothetical protein